jgi:hypothetical protein
MRAEDASLPPLLLFLNTLLLTLLLSKAKQPSFLMYYTHFTDVLHTVFGSADIHEMLCLLRENPGVDCRCVCVSVSVSVSVSVPASVSVSVFVCEVMPPPRRTRGGQPF